MTDFYTVIKGDTLSKIAKTTNKSVSELARLNRIESPYRLAVGRILPLNEKSVLSVQPLFIDRNRDPIEGLEYVMECAGSLIAGVTTKNGLGRKVFTKSVDDEIQIFVKRLDGSLKKIGQVASDVGNKLVTLVSPSIRIDAVTEEHRDVKEGENKEAESNPVPAYGKSQKPAPTPDKASPGIKNKPSKTPDGKPVIVIEGDIPDLSFLGDYSGSEVTNDDIAAVAKELTCDPGLIYAIARQESAKSSFVMIGNRRAPAILFERHWFRILTKPSKNEPSPYEESYHDICGPAYHKVTMVTQVAKDANGQIIHKKNGKPLKIKTALDAATMQPAVDDDIYGAGGIRQYKRLAKAYQLDKSAALKSCSWGKFQIMGFNHKAAGYSTVFEFVKGMSLGEAAHIKAFLKFAQSNEILLSGLRNKNFEKIAEGHNGAQWMTINPAYAQNLKKFYEEYK